MQLQIQAAMALYCRSAGSLSKLVEPNGRGVWERKSHSGVQMHYTLMKFYFVSMMPVGKH